MDAETFSRFLRDTGQEYKDLQKLWGSAEILTKVNGFLDFLDVKYRKEMEDLAVEKHGGPCDCLNTGDVGL